MLYDHKTKILNITKTTKRVEKMKLNKLLAYELLPTNNQTIVEFDDILTS